MVLLVKVFPLLCVGVVVRLIVGIGEVVDSTEIVETGDVVEDVEKVGSIGNVIETMVNADIGLPSPSGVRRV